MTAIDLFRPLSIERMFDDFFKPTMFSYQPSYNLFEDDNGYVMEYQVPGMNKENLKIEIDDGSLHIKGESKEERKNAKHQSFSYQSIDKRIQIPDIVNNDAIEAEVSDGILTLKLPFIKEKKKKRKVIEIT